MPPRHRASPRSMTPLRRALHARGLGVRATATAAGLGHGTVQHVFRGGGITLLTARKLVRAFTWLSYDALAAMLYGEDE